VAQLLNHTAGLDWGLIVDTGEGDDALAGYVARMAELELVAPPGVRASYSQAGYNLAGRLVEKVTGETFERAVASLVLEPLGLQHSFFARDDVMTRRFVVGHNRGEDGTLSVARLWRRARGDNPGGGLVSSVADQLRWARFHLGDGRADSGERVLPAEVLQRMKQPTAVLRGSNLGDAIAIAWFLREVDGVGLVGHGGSANGQFAELLTVPERGFAVVALSNAGPDGIPCNQAVVRWALQAYLGVTDRDPQPLPYDQARAREVVGRYETDAQAFTIDTDGARLTLAGGIKPEIRAAADKPLPPDYPAACCPATRTSTSSPAAVSRGCAASSPATRTARSWASTSLAGCTAGSRRPRSERRGPERAIRRFDHDRRTRSQGRSTHVHRRAAGAERREPDGVVGVAAVRFRAANPAMEPRDGLRGWPGRSRRWIRARSSVTTEPLDWWPRDDEAPTASQRPG
jgi:CubicO group peptidase (beta-lactamase class C family)